MKKRHIAIGVLFILLLIVGFNRTAQSFFCETFIFLKAFFIQPTAVGAVIPSSRFLANAITKHIRRGKKPIRVLEVGAGTGAMTYKILAKLKKDDVLDTVELDPNFCQILKEKFNDKENVSINCLSILDWNPGYLYDYIISGLPFNAFDADFLKLILDKYKQLIKPGGIISYFEYIALANIKLFFLRGKDKLQYSNTLTTSSNFKSRFEFEQETVIANIPPAYVHHLCVQ